MNTPDKYFKVSTIARTQFTKQALLGLGISEYSSGQSLAWYAAHRDYSEELSLYDNPASYRPIDDEDAGRKLPGMIMNKGHFGVLEHAHATFEIVGFPHSVPMQARTHRVGMSFDVQSQRYTGKRVLKLIESVRGYTRLDEDFYNKIDAVFYARPVGTYKDRQGKDFTITKTDRKDLLLSYLDAARDYVDYLNQGWSEECARDVLPQSIRQSFFMTTNTRGLMHFLDMRAKADAQIEIQWLCDLLMAEFYAWSPQIAEWYESKRLKKNKLAP